MITRHSVLFAATALMLAGGCQSAPTGTTTKVANAPRFASEDGYLPQGPHFQTPEEIRKTAEQYGGALAQNGTMGANDVPSPDAMALPDPEAAPPLLPKAIAPQPSGMLYAPRTPVPTAQDPSITRSNSQSAPTYPAPTKVIPPDPAQQARARTLASAVNARSLVGEPDNIPPESDGPKPAAGRIAPDPATEPLEDRLRRQAHDYPRDPLAQLDWELYCTLKEDPTGGFTGVAMLPDTDRELISALVDGVRNFRSCLRTNPDPMFTGKINPLLAMSDVIRSQAELDVPLVAICRSVEKFGNYETMDAMHFPSGTKSKFIVYCEIENFVPQMDAKRMYQTRLVQQVEIFSDSGTEVWSDQSREVDDLCRRQRRDFFLYDIVTLPPNLSPGRYTVKVTVTDLNAKKFTQNVAEIGIVGATEQPKTPIPTSPSGPLWPFPTGTSAGGGAQYEPALPR
jgi:hypothetical protein